MHKISDPVMWKYEEGMTLRDYFAGQALIGLAGDFSKKLQRDSGSCAEMAYL